MKIIGVTGSFGTGKSTVCAMLKKKGAVVIDADAIAHRLLAGDPRVRRRVKAIFGTTARKAIAAAAFVQPAMLKKLIRLTHPAIIARIRKQLKKLKSQKRDRCIVLDAPLLVEANLHCYLDALIVVAARRDIQYSRLLKLGYSRTDISRRIRSQMPLKDKRRLADFIIDNSGTRKETQKQVEAAYAEIHKRRKE